MINEKGGVEGYKIVPIYADAQSKTEVAINEMTRLLDQEKVALIMGVFSSAQCVPMAQRVDASKKFMWANVCVASAVFKDKKLSYVFRPQVHSDQFGEASCTYIAENAKEKLGMDPKKVQGRDHLRGRPLRRRRRRSGNEAKCKALGMRGGAEGGLCGHLARPLQPGDQAEARARRHPAAHRLQPGHHPVPAPVARAGPEVQGASSATAPATARSAS